MEEELIPRHQLVHIGEEFRRGEAGVAGEDGVVGEVAGGQGGPVQVAHGLLQDIFRGAVVDGQGDPDFADLDVAHHAATQVEAVVIVQGDGGGPLLCLVAREILVIGSGLGHHLIVLVLTVVAHLGLIAGHRPGAVEFVVLIAQGGIEENANAHGKEKTDGNIYQFVQGLPPVLLVFLGVFLLDHQEDTGC